MKKYRLVLLLKSDLKKDAKQKLIDDIKSWFGAIKNDKLSELGEKRLAYTIKSEKKGEYVSVEFEVESIKADTEKRIRIQDTVLRHLLVRID